MSTKIVEAIFIRHGQSTANTGEWNQPFAEIPLTKLGEEQAEALAQQWNFVPSLIVQSPFRRTLQTAAPTIARFPEVPVEIWPIHEFTYWDIAYWSGSAPEVEVEDVARFWRVSDPEERRGESESFEELLGRAESALKRLEALQVDAPVLLFTHGHFIQALRHVMLYPEWTARQKMENFRGFDERWKVRNVELVRADLRDGKWSLVSPVQLGLT